MTLFDGIFSGVGGIANILIDDMFGTDYIFEYSSAGTYDKKTMVRTDAIAVVYTIKGTPPEPFTKDEVDGTTHERGLMEFLISEVAVITYGEPPIGSTVTFNDIKWRIIAVEPIRSGDQMAAYTIVVGKL